jgi:putative oxidoreductase
MGRLDAWAPRVLSLLRIVAALLFMEHGLMKIFEFPAAQQGIPSPMPAILVAAGWIEIIGGALIALGLFTRVAAFVASGEMAVAFFMGHVARTGVIWPALNMGDAAVLYCWVFFYLVFAGPGPWSLDAIVRKRS